MPFSFQNLDEKTRQFMVEEVETARNTGNLYFSKRFNDRGHTRWPDLLREAAVDHTEHWLAYQIEAEGLMKGFEGARIPLGGYTIRHVPNTAAETQAEGQFNRFYILGICRRALADGKSQVIVYRAKERAEHRPESDALIGTTLSAQDLISALRSVQLSLGHELLKPNSGLSVHL